jgi:hypothetical protein
MTTHNWLFILAISAMAAAGFWGVGRLGVAKMTPENQTGALSQGMKPVYGSGRDICSVADVASVSQWKPQGVPFRTVDDDAKQAFEKAFGEANLGVSFDDFKKAPDKLAGRFSDSGLIPDLKKKLESPTTVFEVPPLERKQLVEFITPKPADVRFSAHVDPGKIPASFCWVKTSSDKGCWFSDDEVEKPASKVLLVDDITLPCTQPTADQWKAACANADIKHLDKAPFGKGEILRDGKVVGCADFSELTQDGKWKEPFDAEARKTATIKLVGVKANFAPAQIEAERDRLLDVIKKTKGQAETFKAEVQNACLAQAKANLKEKAEQDAAKNAEKESFAYRIVVEYPIP